MSPIVFINTGWMKYYQGHTKDDPLMVKNFSWFSKERNNASKGHEQFNFRRKNGYVYGYVPRSTNIDIRKLGAGAKDGYIEDVLVVFVAHDPYSHQHVVVGWFSNATVTKGAQFRVRHGQFTIETPIRTAAGDEHVLPVADRSCLQIPIRGDGGLGRNPVWYARKHPEIIAAVRSAVDRSERTRVTKPKSRSGPRQPDITKRLAVERAAMLAALSYFDGAVDVSDKKLGWDIEATAEGKPVMVEVKGLSGVEVAFELTPNEYEKMFQLRERYVLFVVTRALTKQLVTRSFRFDNKFRPPGGLRWVSERDEALVLQEHVGARASI